MTEYIEREALIKHIERSFGEISTPFVVREIKDFPYADVVEVVRCKDCVRCDHFFPECDKNGNCREVYYCKSIEGNVKPTDFCSYGERRDKDGTTL